MRHYYGYAEDFHYILEAFPVALAELRGWILGGFGIHVPAEVQHIGWVWGTLVDAKSEDRAADIVAELVLTKGGPRVLELVQAQANDDELYIRADDPELVHVLFDHEELSYELGDFVADYWLRSRGPNPRPGAPLAEQQPPRAPPEPPGPAEEDPHDEDIRDTLRQLRRRLDERFTGPVTTYRASAPLNSGLGFQRVSVSQRDYLTADPEWREQELEDFLWENWERIDFGLPAALVLFDRQVRINPDRRDRVDLLARSESNDWYAIELKIVGARTRDLTQLLSYMSDLTQEGVPPDNVRGLLIAPDFDSKLINAAAIQPQVELLRFRLPGQG